MKKRIAIIFYSSVRTVLGNLEDLKDYHRHTLLPKLEDAVQDSQLIRCYQILSIL